MALVEMSRQGVSSTEAIESLMVAALPKQTADRVASIYTSARNTLRMRLNDDPLPHYTSLEWRLDVQLASRSLRAPEPLYYIALHTRRQSTKETTMLQVEPETLRHIATELDNALNELKSANVRRIMRNVK